MGLPVHVESGVGGHIDDATQAWLFDVEHWGVCGQGHDETSALTALSRITGLPAGQFEVIERIEGDERAFDRDLVPATDVEVDVTGTILTRSRAATLELIRRASEAELDWDDPERILPSWASWRTLRQMGWHLADTETRYYLAQLEIPPPPTATDLLAELRQSHEHVLKAIATVPRDVRRDDGAERWTTTKVLRRLAWHERSELEVMTLLLTKAQAALA